MWWYFICVKPLPYFQLQYLFHCTMSQVTLLRIYVDIYTYIYIKQVKKNFKGSLNEDTICVYVRIIYANRNRTCNTDTNTATITSMYVRYVLSCAIIMSYSSPSCYNYPKFLFHNLNWNPTFFVEITLNLQNWEWMKEWVSNEVYCELTSKEIM